MRRTTREFDRYTNKMLNEPGHSTAVKTPFSRGKSAPGIAGDGKYIDLEEITLTPPSGKVQVVGWGWDIGIHRLGGGSPFGRSSDKSSTNFCYNDYYVDSSTFTSAETIKLLELT